MNFDLVVEIMRCLFSVLVITIVFGVWYFLFYMEFYNVLTDDVKFGYQKTRLRNRWNKTPGFWKKILFLDIKHKVIKWHYILFWINLVSAVFMYIGLIIYALIGNSVIRPITIIFIVIHILSIVPICFVRLDLYKQRYFKNIKKYRKRKP